MLNKVKRFLDATALDPDDSLV